MMRRDMGKMKITLFNANCLLKPNNSLYEKPTMTVVELQHRACLLQASGEQQPENVPNYGDWLG